MLFREGWVQCRCGVMLPDETKARFHFRTCPVTLIEIKRKLEETLEQQCEQLNGFRDAVRLLAAECKKVITQKDDACKREAELELQVDVLRKENALLKRQVKSGKYIESYNHHNCYKIEQTLNIFLFGDVGCLTLRDMDTVMEDARRDAYVKITKLDSTAFQTEKDKQIIQRGPPIVPPDSETPRYMDEVYY